MDDDISVIIKNEFKFRIFEEFIPRIEKCLNLLTVDQIWYSSNKHTNSIGNLILHLCGNVRQWICSGIGGEKDIRIRDYEFENTSAFDHRYLLEILAALQAGTDKALSDLTQRDLVEKVNIQGFTQSRLSAIIHVIEHFSYHTGQIALITKQIKEEDLGFYEGRNLNATN